MSFHDSSRSAGCSEAGTGTAPIRSWVMTTPCYFGSAVVRGDSITAHNRRRHTALCCKPRIFSDALLYSLRPRFATVIFGAGQRPEALHRHASPLPESEIRKWHPTGSNGTDTG